MENDDQHVDIDNDDDELGNQLAQMIINDNIRVQVDNNILIEDILSQEENETTDGDLIKEIIAQMEINTRQITSEGNTRCENDDIIADIITQVENNVNQANVSGDHLTLLDELLTQIEIDSNRNTITSNSNEDLNVINSDAGRIEAGSSTDPNIRNINRIERITRSDGNTTTTSEGTTSIDHNIIERVSAIRRNIDRARAISGNDANTNTTETTTNNSNEGTETGANNIGIFLNGLIESLRNGVRSERASNDSNNNSSDEEDRNDFIENHSTTYRHTNYDKACSSQSAPLDNCAICFTEYRNNEICRRLPCLHAYHKGCIDEWLSQSNICPVCRISIDNVE